MSSTSKAALSTMRLAPQLGQKPLRLQLKATRPSLWHEVHWTLMNPCSMPPHFRKCSASLGCAIITGPSDANIAEDINFLGDGQGVVQVEDMKASWETIIELLQNPERAQELGREAQARLARQPDIAQKYLSAIEPYL